MGAVGIVLAALIILILAALFGWALIHILVAVAIGLILLIIIVFVVVLIGVAVFVIRAIL